MNKDSKPLSIRNLIVFIVVFMNAIILRNGFTINNTWYWGLLITVPMLVVAIIDITQRKHAIIRNFPLIGHLRYFFEFIRPELRQYFFESDLDGKPFNRRQRSIVYQRAKNEKQTVAFGMQADPT
jgi:glutamate synthase domain-containing protein 2